MNFDILDANTANRIMVDNPRIAQFNGIHLDDQMIKGPVRYEIKHIDRDGYAIARRNDGKMIHIHTDQFAAGRYHR